MGEKKIMVYFIVTEEELEMLKFFVSAGYLMIMLPRNQLDKKRLIRMWKNCLEKNVTEVTWRPDVLNNFLLLYMKLISVAFLVILVYIDSLYIKRKKIFFSGLSIAQSWDMNSLTSSSVLYDVGAPCGREGTGMMKSIILPLRICFLLPSSLILLKPSFLLNKDWFVVVIPWCSQSLHLSCTLHIVSRALLLLQCLILWVVILSISVCHKCWCFVFKISHSCTVHKSSNLLEYTSY